MENNRVEQLEQEIIGIVERVKAERDDFRDQLQKQLVATETLRARNRELRDVLGWLWDEVDHLIVPTDLRETVERTLKVEGEGDE